MLSSASLLFYVSIIVNIGISHGQLQALKVIPKGGVDDGLASSAQFLGASVPNTGNQFTNADRICVFGVWALYSTTNYGLGQESTTTVISVVGKNPNKLECSNSGQIRGLTQVKSVRYFGSRNVSEPAIAILSDAYLLGGSWEVFQGSATIDRATTDITGVRLGSIAITGTSSWQLCSDPECVYTICVDVPKSRYGILYLNRNTVGDTLSKWPLVIQNVQAVDQATCANTINTNYQKPLLWRIELDQMDEKSGLDYHEWIPTPNDTTAALNDDTDSITTTVIP